MNNVQTARYNQQSNQLQQWMKLLGFQTTVKYEVNIVVCIGTGTLSWSNVVYTAAEDTHWLRIVINNQQFQQVRP